jgi:hypothetical protein
VHLYFYDGPVMTFNTLIANRWNGTTYAATEKAARNNLTFRFKTETGRTAGANIALPGKIKKLDAEQSRGR